MSTSTSTEAPERPRGWRHRIAMIAALALTATLAFVLYRSWASTSSEMTPGQVRAAVGTQLVSAMEHATPADHAAHGHYDVGGTTKVLCTVEVLGYEPADATDTRQVTRSYANHQCAVSDNGRPWEYAVKTSGLLIATGQPPVVQVVAEGADYAGRVRAAAIPAQYLDKALATSISQQALTDLRARFDVSVKEFWAAFKASNPPAG
ncbi:hypothetical protein GCM10009682_29580 [Luedemannella flava]|uniref:Uncharacterized protein n=1 Tax=Luedemannella flava TaxID=349316 RepID=A0ABP4Y713_9ACTN